MIGRVKSVRSKARCESCYLRGKICVQGYGETDHPDIAFIGQAPGENEVEQGKPFVGKAGLFLRMVLRDLGIKENRCYFTNTCLCRPNNDKKPTVKAVKLCMPRLVNEIAAIQPKLIVTLGGVSTSGFLKLKRGITKCHGEYKLLKFKSGFQVGGIPTYHPSGVLRGPDFFIDFVEELDFAKRILDGETPVIEPPYHNYKFITTQKQLDVFLPYLAKHKLMACDIEDDGKDWASGKILCIGFSWKREHAYVVDWEGLIENNLTNLQALDEALKGVHLSFQYGLHDVPFLLHAGLKNVDYYFDTLLAHYLMDERQNTHGLERLSIRYYKAPAYKSTFRAKMGLGSKVPPDVWMEAVTKAGKTNLFRYNGADVDYTFRLTQDLAKMCKADGQIEVLKDTEMPAARMFMEFHMNGMLIDQPYWRKMARGWAKEIKALEIELRSYPGVDFKLGSVPKLAHYLYDVLHLLPFGGKASFGKRKIDEEDISKAIREVDDPEAREYWTSKRTQMSEGLKGFGGEAKGLSPRSTTTYMLYYLKQQHPFPGVMIKWRHFRKRYGMYYKGIKDVMWKDGRVHPQYNMTATRTGRKATEDPAIHNLPRGDDIYNVFIAPPGWVIIHADYITAEMRMMAYYAKDKHLLHIIDTMDIHSVYAMAIFNLTQKEWDKLDKTTQKNLRIAAKMITFGIPYGRSAAGLAPQLGCTKAEAQEYIDTFYREFAPRLPGWLARVRKKGLQQQYLRGILGRKRRFPFIRDRYHRREVERQLGNFMIQTTINDMTLRAEIKSIPRLGATGIPARPWPHIHDSLNILVPKPLWKSAVQIINDTMNEVPFETDVSFPAEIEIGERWGDMKVVMRKGEWVEEQKPDTEVENPYLEEAPV